MSDIIYSRAAGRERGIWPSFFFNEAFTSAEQADRAIIFGLYSGVYLYGQSYLEDIESEALQKLVDTYNNNMASLTMEDQALVLNIAAKRYVFNVDLLIAKDKLVTKQQQLTANTQAYETRLAALNVDTKELETLQEKIIIVKEIAAVRVKELEAAIAIEKANSNSVDAQILEKQLSISQAELQELVTALEGLKIQITIAEVGLRITKEEANKYQYKSDIARIDAEIKADTDLITDQLAVDNAELTALEYSVDNLTTKKIELVNNQGDYITEEISGLSSEQTKTIELWTERLNGMTAELAARKQALQDTRVSAEEYKDILTLQDNPSDKNLADENKIAVLERATKKLEIDLARVTAAANIRVGTVDAARALAKANITSTLTHAISGV